MDVRPTGRRLACSSQCSLHAAAAHFCTLLQLLTRQSRPTFPPCRPRTSASSAPGTRITLQCAFNPPHEWLLRPPCPRSSPLTLQPPWSTLSTQRIIKLDTAVQPPTSEGLLAQSSPTPSGSLPTPIHTSRTWLLPMVQGLRSSSAPREGTAQSFKALALECTSALQSLNPFDTPTPWREPDLQSYLSKLSCRRPPCLR